MNHLPNFDALYPNRNEDITQFFTLWGTQIANWRVYFHGIFSVSKDLTPSFTYFFWSSGFEAPELKVDRFTFTYFFSVSKDMTPRIDGFTYFFRSSGFEASKLRLDIFTSTQIFQSLTIWDIRGVDALTQFFAFEGPNQMPNFLKANLPSKSNMGLTSFTHEMIAFLSQMATSFWIWIALDDRDVLGQSSIGKILTETIPESGILLEKAPTSSDF